MKGLGERRAIRPFEASDDDVVRRRAEAIGIAGIEEGVEQLEDGPGEGAGSPDLDAGNTLIATMRLIEVWRAR